MYNTILIKGTYSRDFVYLPLILPLLFNNSFSNKNKNNLWLFRNIKYIRELTNYIYHDLIL